MKKFELGNVDVAYPNEPQGTSRKLELRTDGEFLHIDLIDPKIEAGCITLDKKEIKLLADTFNLILKNNLIED